MRLDGEPFALRPGVIAWAKAGERSTQPIRTLFVTHNLNWEGAPLCQFELIRGMQKAGVVEPILFSPQDGTLRAIYEAAGIPLIVPPSTTAEIRATHLTQTIRQHGIELLHANTLDTAWAVIGAAQTQTPCLWNIHESEDWYTYFRRYAVTRAREALQALAIPYRVIFVSKASRTVWQGLERTGNFCVIHNGFDHEHFNARLGKLTRTAARQQLDIADDQFVLLAMGTVCERKRQHDLIHSFAALPTAIAAQLRLLIVGDRPSPYSDQLHRLIAKLPPTRRAQVTVVPETSAVAPFWRAADLFCCTAQIESFPRTLQEAMACGLPIITTPVYGIRELVRSGYNAESYPPGNITALANAINRLVTDDALRQRYATNAPVVLAGALTFGEMIDEYTKLVNEARITAAGALPATPVSAHLILENLAATAKLRLATFASFRAKARRSSR